MQKLTTLVMAGVLLALGILLIAQRGSLRDVTNRVAALEGQGTVESVPSVRERMGGDRPIRPAATDRTDFLDRISELEHTVAQLTRATESLMEKGQLALSTNKVDELQRRLLNASAADKERLHALRLLRRNHGFSDEVVQSALSWLNTATNGEVRRDILQQLDGVTNAIVRAPLVSLAMTDTDPKVRAEAVEKMRRLTGDTEVDARLWEILRNDQDPRVRERAEDALRDGQMTPDRAARLAQRAVNAQAAVDERILAMQALVNSGADVSSVTPSMVQLAQNSTDPKTRAEIFNAFDGALDPNMLSPLVGGLQDADAGVRKAAADALSGFAADPRIRQWLEFVAQSDTDTRARREAQQALKAAERQR